MGLFSKKVKKSESEMPVLPRLPRLPDLPDAEEFSERSIHQLPIFPSNSLGTKFSQDSIKDAVSGGRRGGDFYADDFSSDEMRMMQEPLRRPTTEEIEEEQEEEFAEMSRKQMGGPSPGFRAEAEPVFVRIDRFEESLKLFERVKDQISAIERMLAETKRLKEKEEAELHSWELELKRMREEIEKIGMTIFSKV